MNCPIRTYEEYPEQNREPKPKNHKIYLQTTDGEILPSQFNSLYTREGALKIAATMNQGYAAEDGLKYVARGVEG